jgi:signal transduction histidine kinase
MAETLEARGLGGVEDRTTAEAEPAGDRGEVTSHVSAAAFQVAQAAEGLRQAEGLLRAAEELTSDAERRRVEADDRLAELERRNAELEQMLAIARTRRDGSVERGLTVIVDDERDGLKEAVAAEIRRPLTSILGATLALKHTDAGSSDGRAMVRQLAMNAHRLERLVDQLLELDRLVSGSLEPKRRRTDLGALVRRVVEETPDIANREVEVDAEHVAISVDPALTEQIVEALLTNAGRRTAPGERVRVTIRSGHGGALIAVDDGSSEPATGLPNRGSSNGASDRSKQPTSLALVLRLAELHLGRAWIEAHPARGASFRVFLPDGTPAGAADVAGDAADRSEEPSTPEDVFVDTTVAAPNDVLGRLRELDAYHDVSDEVTI